MGLDLIELTLTVENEFHITFSDEDAANIRTAGQLLAYIMTHAKLVPAEQCPGATVFRRLRRALVRMLGCGPRDIRPRTALAEALPVKARQRQWPELHCLLGLALPNLRRPTWVTGLFAGIPIAVAVLACVGLRTRLDSYWTAFIVACVAIVCVGLAAALARPFAREAAGCRTVGDLAKAVLACNYTVIQDRTRTAEEQIWDRLAGIIAEQSAVDKSRIRPETDFIKDVDAN